MEDLEFSQFFCDTLREECLSSLQDISALSLILHQYSEMYANIAISITDSYCSPESVNLEYQIERTGRPGRPAVVLSREHIEILMDCGYNYSSISRMFGISQRTLLRRRNDYELPLGRQYSQITDAELDAIVREIIQVSDYRFNNIIIICCGRKLCIQEFQWFWVDYGREEFVCSVQELLIRCAELIP